VSADLADAEQNSGDAAGDVYVAIEDLQGSGFDDHLLGNSGSNRLSGGAGADVLEGRDGMDTLDGGAGDDRLAGGAGVDTFVFAPGYGRDRVLDFADATDLLDHTAFGFTRFNEVMARASETRATGSGDVFDLVIDVGDGSQLTIEHFRIADFDASVVLL
jgi:Ca2+-binding RTX toxin-like protein